MSFVAVAIAGSAVVGGIVASKSASNANKTQQQLAAQNNAIAERERAVSTAALEPYASAGLPATNSIQALLGLGGQAGADTARAAFDTYRGSTGYQFRKDEGAKAVTAALGRGNMLESGAADKARMRFADNLASDEFGRYLSTLEGQQRVGLTGASAQAGVGQGFVSSVTANNRGAADAAGNAGIATGNAVNQALGGITSAVGYGAGLRSSYGPSQIADYRYGG